MCGIAGWIDWERDLRQEEPTVRAMGATLVCRGPDADGLYLTKAAAFAHRRLVVVDPDGGSQPMTRRAGDWTYTLVYNGELYNTEDIRAELTALGYTFQSYSDTEVLLTAYMAWGEACVDKLNGIFAFAIWDEREQALFMARDRLGVKPLFYARRGSSFVFASELKALLVHPLVEPVVDSEGLAEIFAVGPARTPGHGIFKDVFELRPGHLLWVTRRGERMRAYWQLEAIEHTDDLDTTVQTVHDLFIDTVRRQLVSDVPVCTFLSGGIDSSAVTAIAALAYREWGRAPLHTFAIELEDMEKHFRANAFQKSIDAPWAKRVADHLGTIHHPLV
ncbi:MAG: asparagine synthase (glutamine-hydrolyzing), partial [Alicyclobacillus sp.]|nr:asparagine synthase (glutamine-hydrolyzing) [Alicyclobacillus sp.]